VSASVCIDRFHVTKNRIIIRLTDVIDLLGNGYVAAMMDLTFADQVARVESDVPGNDRHNSNVLY